MVIPPVLKTGIPYGICGFESHPLRQLEFCKRKSSASRREATSANLHFPNRRCILEIARTEFYPRPPSADSDWAGRAK